MIVRVALIVVVCIAGYCIRQSIKENSATVAVNTEMLKRLDESLNDGIERRAEMFRNNPRPRHHASPLVKPLDRSYLDKNPEFDGQDNREPRPTRTRWQEARSDFDDVFTTVPDPR